MWGSGGTGSPVTAGPAAPRLCPARYGVPRGGRAQAKPVLPYWVAETPTEGGYQRKGLKRRWHISITETSGGFLKSRVTFALAFGAAGQEEVNSVLPVNACGPALPPAVVER